MNILNQKISKLAYGDLVLITKEKKPIRVGAYCGKANSPKYVKIQSLNCKYFNGLHDVYTVNINDIKPLDLPF